MTRPTRIGKPAIMLSSGIGGAIGSADGAPPPADCCADPADVPDRAASENGAYAVVLSDPTAGGLVQSATARADSGVLTTTLGDAPTPGNLLEVWLWARGGSIAAIAPVGFDLIDQFDSSPFFLWHGYRVVEGGDGASVSTDGTFVGGMRMVVAEFGNIDPPDDTVTAILSPTYSADHSISPSGSGLVTGIFLHNTDISGRETHISSPSTLIEEGAVDFPGNGPYGSVGYRDAPPLTAHSGNTTFHDLAYIVSTHPANANVAAWVVPAPMAIDGDDTTYDFDIDGPNVIRIDLGAGYEIATLRLRIACQTSGARTYMLVGANELDFSDAVTVATLPFTATGSFAAQDVNGQWTPTGAYRFWQLDGDDETRRILTLELREATLATNHQHSLDSLTDVETDGVVDGDFLAFDDYLGLWVPTEPPSGSVPDGTDPGDLLVWDGAAWAVLPIGADDEMLYADSGESLGIRWGAAPSPGGGSEDPIAEVFGTPTTPFEFDTSSTTGLTAYSPTPDVIDIHTTIPGHLYVKDNASGVARCGYYASAPSAPFTAICKISDGNVRSDYHQIGLAIGQATPGTMNSIQWAAASRRVETEVQTPTGFTSALANALSDIQTPLYLAILVNSSTDVDFLYSYGGRIWAYLTEARNPSITIGSVGVWFASNNANGGAAAFDFLRIWDSAKTFPGVY